MWVYECFRCGHEGELDDGPFQCEVCNYGGIKLTSKLGLSYTQYEDEPLPKSNDGFSVCQFGCEERTTKLKLFSFIVDHCPKCKR
jgi:hypothetical protein